MSINPSFDFTADHFTAGTVGEPGDRTFFLQAAGGSPDEVRAERLRRPAHAFISLHRSLVSQRPFLEGLGAVGPGHEWAIPKMFKAVIPGLRRAGFDEAEIAYFTLHVEQDDDHGAWLEEALEPARPPLTCSSSTTWRIFLSLTTKASSWGW